MSNRSDRPNVIFISTDQQRYDTLRCYGSTVAQTPHIDRLADEGVRFDQCYTTNTVCMPARASFFTGQYPSHHGVWMNGVPLDPNSDMIQNRLSQAGYHTALIGKIHLDNIWLRTEKHPSYGFDLLIECQGDPYCKDEYFRWLDDQGLYEPYMVQFKRERHKRGYTRDLPEEKHMNNWITRHVEEYLSQQTADGQPFFLSVGFFDPHHPFDPIEPYASQFDPDAMPMPLFREGEQARMTPPAAGRVDLEHNRDPEKIRKTIAAYHATMAHVDAMVGRIMGALEEHGLDENTIVIFTSDHGEMLGDHGLLHKGPLFYEGALRVPLIYRFPQHMNRRGVESRFVSHVDLAPTIAELAGVPGVERHQGMSLFDGDTTRGRDAAMVEWRERPVDEDGPYQTARCLVTDRYKFVEYVGETYGELYDLQSDPDEYENLWTDHAHRDTIAQLKERSWHFTIDSDPCPTRTDIF